MYTTAFLIARSDFLSLLGVDFSNCYCLSSQTADLLFHFKKNTGLTFLFISTFSSPAIFPECRLGNRVREQSIIFTFWDFKLAKRELFGWDKGYCSLNGGTPFKCLIQMVKSLLL